MLPFYCFIISGINKGRSTLIRRLLHRWIRDAVVYGGGLQVPFGRALSGQALCWDRDTRFTRFGTRRGVTTNGAVRRRRRQVGARPGPGAIPQSVYPSPAFVAFARPLPLLASSIGTRIPSQRIPHPLSFPTTSLSPLLVLWRGQTAISLQISSV